MKPHKGTIDNWRIIPAGDRLIVAGKFVDHPQFAGMYGHTSWIVDVDGFEVETRNSRYTLGRFGGDTT